MTLLALFFAAESAQWIWAPGSPLPNQAYFRRSVALSSPAQKAELTITCDDSYVLYVNGKKIGHHESWYTMQTFNLRRSLHLGHNIICVAAKNTPGTPAGLYIDGEAKTKEGSASFRTGDAWRVSTTPSVAWLSEAHDDSAWTAPRLLGELGVQPWGQPTREIDLLRGMDSLPLAHPVARRATHSLDAARGYIWPANANQFERLPISPVSLKGGKIGKMANGPRTLRADFGEEIAGWVEVALEGDGEPDVNIQVGEASKPQGPFSTVSERQGRLTIYRILPTGQFTGFRNAWIKIGKSDKPVKLAYVRAIYRVWPANYAGSFECSDKLLNQIWDIGAYSVHLNLDPQAISAILRPERGDRFPWMGDDRVAHRTIFDVFGGYKIAKADLDFFVKPGDKTIAVNDIPGYTLDWVIALYDYWMVSGDASEVRKHLGDVATILHEYSSEQIPKGWLFTDWEPGLQSTTAESVLAFHYKYFQAAREAAMMAASTGEEALAEEFGHLAEKRKAFLDGSTTPLGQHALTNAILAGLRHRLPSSIPATTSTPYFTYYVLEALSKVGDGARALDGLRGYWGGMIRLGATSTWEYFRPEWVRTMKLGEQPPDIKDPKIADFEVSLCHPWSSGATAWLSDHLLGVTPLEPGFKKCQIRPYFGVAWARGSIPTPRGPVSVSWVRHKAGPELSFHSPTATRLMLPSKCRYIVDGKPAKPSLQSGEDSVFQFQSGGQHVVRAIAGWKGEGGRSRAAG